jgi:hypothetical protein
VNVVDVTAEDPFAEPLLEEALVPVPTPGRERSWPEDVAPPEARDLPIVSIGRPRAWPLEDVLDVPSLPAEMQATLARERFLFLRLSCSFRPRRQKTSIAFARFSADLIAEPAADDPAVAFDLYPRSIEHTSTVTKRVAFAPTLAFTEVEAGVGEASRTIEYPSVEPVVSASGIDEQTPSWDFSAVRGNPLQGGKLLFVIVSAPRLADLLRVNLSLAATLDHHGLRLPALLGGRPGTDEDALSTAVWAGA